MVLLRMPWPFQGQGLSSASSMPPGWCPALTVNAQRRGRSYGRRGRTLPAAGGCVSRFRGGSLPTLSILSAWPCPLRGVPCLPHLSRPEQTSALPSAGSSLLPLSATAFASCLSHGTHSSLTHTCWACVFSPHHYQGDLVSPLFTHSPSLSA